ncbi:MAG: hypothetical protein ACPG8W_09660 [Candidatus Promineifilaceae bacterium]
MIVAATIQLQDKLHQVDQLNQRKKHRQTISATLQALRRFGEQIRAFDTQYRLIREYIPSEKDEKIQTVIVDLYDNLECQRVAFSTENKPDQREAIRNLSNKQLKSLLQYLQTSWTSYTRIQSQAPLELLRLVQDLRELRQQAKQLERLRKQVEISTSSLPKSENDVDQFKRSLSALQAALANLSGLNPDVKQFLQKIRTNSASLGDLTDEVLAWCRENPERASSFLIKLT